MIEYNQDGAQLTAVVDRLRDVLNSEATRERLDRWVAPGRYCEIGTSHGQVRLRFYLEGSKVDVWDITRDTQVVEGERRIRMFFLVEQVAG